MGVLQLANAAAELAAAKDELVYKEREVIELKAAVGDKDRAIKQLEIELLTASQKLAAEAGDHAQQMQDQADEINGYKVSSTSLQYLYCCVCYVTIMSLCVVCVCVLCRPNCVMLRIDFIKEKQNLRIKVDNLKQLSNRLTRLKSWHSACNL